MLSARTLLHVIITLSVVLHGAWMAAMPIAHAAPVLEAEATVAHADGRHKAHAAHDAHAHQSPHADHAAHDTPAPHAHHAHHGGHASQQKTACAEPEEPASAQSSHHGHDAHTGGEHHDHDMSGCECTLCKISSLAAVDTQLQLASCSHRDARPRVHPAQQVQATTGPPVGLRAPPVPI